ncbi:MAG: Glycosyltransferase involved in cell wall bisynthesis [Verrucomicrobia bacterium]|jgi:glycosyltransferase involved in cell wall biosynthesis|nr:MAG: Glycosyltransferase involved in cell wall bisynthesis [Verrucomicrobiota bacterium]
MPRVSIVIPSYNSAKYLPETLQSVLQQDYQDFEVIVVNDGSTDDTESWFAAHVSDPRLRLITQANQGPSTARNTGIAASRGEYIAFLDSDDLWHPTKLTKQLEILDGDPHAAMVYCWLANIDHLGNPTGKIRRYFSEGMVWPELIKHNFIGCGSNAMVRRRCFDDLGLFDPATTGIEDWDMWLRIADHHPFRVIREPLVYYRQHPASLSNNWFVLEKSFQRVLEKAFSSTEAAKTRLKSMSYAMAYLCLSWKPVQSRHRNHVDSSRLLRQAVSYDPKLRLTAGYMRLALTILLVRYFGAARYETLLNQARRARKALSSFLSPQQFLKSAR